MTEQRIGADCKTCRATTTHERISPASYGQWYFQCKICGSVFHIPKQPQERPS